MKNIINGISFGAVCNSEERLLDLVKQDYKCLEIHALDYDRMDKIIERCRKNGVEYAIHYPSIYSVSKVEFDVMDLGKRKNVLVDFENYINRYGDAVYYVIHFPNARVIGLQIDDYIDSLSEIYNRFKNQGENLLIENLSYLSVGEYKKICDCVGVHLCLDIGHSYLLGNKDLETYFAELEDRIKVIHYYNTSRDVNDVYYGKHVPFSYEVSEGVNKEMIDQMIHALHNKIYMIDETDGKYYFNQGDNE